MQQVLYQCEEEEAAEEGSDEFERRYGMPVVLDLGEEVVDHEEALHDEDVVPIAVRETLHEIRLKKPW